MSKIERPGRQRIVVGQDGAGHFTAQAAGVGDAPGTRDDKLQGIGPADEAAANSKTGPDVDVTVDIGYDLTIEKDRLEDRVDGDLPAEVYGCGIASNGKRRLVSIITRRFGSCTLVGGMRNPFGGARIEQPDTGLDRIFLQRNVRRNRSVAGRSAYQGVVGVIGSIHKGIAAIIHPRIVEARNPACQCQARCAKTEQEQQQRQKQAQGGATRNKIGQYAGISRWGRKRNGTGTGNSLRKRGYYIASS